MSHWRKQFFDKNEHNLGSWDLWSDETGKFESVVVTIEKYGFTNVVSEQGTDKKPCVYFKEFKKPMPLIVKNFRRLEKKFGSVDPDSYLGKQVLLQVEKEKAFGDVWDVLRFSSREIPAHLLSKEPKKEAPKQATGGLAEMTETEFTAQLQAVKDGKKTIAQLQKVRTIPEHMLTQFKEAENGK